MGGKGFRDSGIQAFRDSGVKVLRESEGEWGKKPARDAAI